MTGLALSRQQGRLPSNAEPQVAASYVTRNILQQPSGVCIHEALDDLLICLFLLEDVKY
jgi:hypothetical protein